MIHKSIIPAVLLLILTWRATLAQELPNGGFENWSVTDFFEEPSPFATSNSLTYMMSDTTNVVKTTDTHSGSYAVRMETMALGGDTIPGLMMIGRLDDDFIAGGVPFASRPDSLAGYMKYNLQGGDEIYIVCLFTRQGIPMGSIETTFSGNQGSYTRFSVAVDWFIPFLNPDTLKIVIANTSDVTSGNPGSVAYFDDFQFIGTSSAFPNGGFENWTMQTSEEPDDWTTLNYLTNTSGPPYATKSNDKHNGNWALRIQNTGSFAGENIGFVTNGRFQGFEWAGGIPVDQNPSLLSGYYKYEPSGNDSAMVGIFTYSYDATGDSLVYLEDQIQLLPAAASYTYFEVPLSYNGALQVDTVNITFSAGLFPDIMNAGSTLLLDDISLEYYPVAVKDNNQGKDLFHVVANPAGGYLAVFSSEQQGNERVFVEVLDIQGRVVASAEATTGAGECARANITHLAPGIYIYRVIRADQGQAGKFILAR